MKPVTQKRAFARILPKSVLSSILGSAKPNVCGDATPTDIISFRLQSVLKEGRKEGVEGEREGGKKGRGWGRERAKL